MQLNSKSQTTHRVIGEGVFESTPPVIQDAEPRSGSSLDGSSIEYLSWVGSLRAVASMKMGGWVGEHIRMEDFVVMTIGKSAVPWEDARSVIGIQLVTDACEPLNMQEQA